MSWLAGLFRWYTALFYIKFGGEGPAARFLYIRWREVTRHMQKHVVLTAVGLLLGLLALAWVQPNTSGGASLLILVTIIVVNAVGVVVNAVGVHVNPRSPQTNKKRQPKGKSKIGKA
jgi:multisubunit Na+/H+ antiporter MnhG subunit